MVSMEDSRLPRKSAEYHPEVEGIWCHQGKDGENNPNELRNSLSALNLRNRMRRRVEKVNLPTKFQLV